MKKRTEGQDVREKLLRSFAYRRYVGEVQLQEDRLLSRHTLQLCDRSVRFDRAARRKVDLCVVIQELLYMKRSILVYDTPRGAWRIHRQERDKRTFTVSFPTPAFPPAKYWVFSLYTFASHIQHTPTHR